MAPNLGVGIHRINLRGAEGIDSHKGLHLIYQLFISFLKVTGCISDQLVITILKTLRLLKSRPFIQPCSNCKTKGDRYFAVLAPTLWNPFLQSNRSAEYWDCLSRL